MKNLRRKREPKPEPKHGTTSESMVAWRCKCGGCWRNDNLRHGDGQQKTDEELVVERDEAFLTHVREMEKGGF